MPIVHFYGPKELQFILGDVSPRVYVTAARFRSHDYLENLSALAAELADVEIVAVVGGSAPSGMRPFDGLMEGDPVGGAARVDPAMPAVIPYTSGTTANPARTEAERVAPPTTTIANTKMVSFGPNWFS